MKLLSAVAALALVPLTSFAATIPGNLPPGWTAVGTAGSGTPDGVVTATPTGGTNYTYVSTAGGPPGGGTLSQPGFNSSGSTNGSTLTTSTFAATAGEKLEFFFNFVTSDGAGFADYAWVKLLNATAGTDFLMFTARTTPSGNTVPGFGMPAVGAGVTVNPPTVLVTPGGPSWSGLGGSSGTCYNIAGCGYTGWVASSFTIVDNANYQLQFGVSNWTDQIFHTGLAIAGAKIGDKPIDPGDGGPSEVPLPAAGWLMLAGLGGLGAMRRRKAA